MQSSTLSSVCIEVARRGAWDVAVPGASEHIACATLEDARLVAYRWAAEQRSCELIVRDAYHRVVAREFLDSSQPE